MYEKKKWVVGTLRGVARGVPPHLVQRAKVLLALVSAPSVAVLFATLKAN